MPKITAIVAAVLALQVTQQQQRPVFRTGLTTVAVPVSVYDEEGEIVTRLAREDFLLFDDGHRQDITNFTSGLQPVTAVALVDTSASMTTSLDLARMAAEQFVIRLRPEDKAKVGSFTDRVTLSPEFTSDRDELLRALREDLRISNRTQLFNAIDAAITELAPRGGRRVIVLFTDGCDTASTTSWSQVVDRLHAEEVLLYAIQFRPRIRPRAQNGRSLTFGDLPRSRSSSNRPMLNGCEPHYDLELSQATPLSDFLHPEDPRYRLSAVQILDRVTGQTGGVRLMLGEGDDVNRTFTRIANEIHFAYLLGFVPQTLDGKTHTIDVRVTDRTMTVRARRSYVAAAPATR